MKKWMKGLSVSALALMTFAAVGSVNVWADEDDGKITAIRVEYDGDPVKYEEEIDKDDFIVEIKVQGESGWHDADNFYISEDTMNSTRYERVEVSVECPVTGKEWTKTVRVECAPAELVEIEATYEGDDLLVGSEIDEDDVEVIAYYDDDTEKKVTRWEFDDYDLEEGRNDIVIIYEEDDIECETDITVYAYEGEIDYISATYNGVIVEVGGTVNKDYITVKAVYDTDHGDVSEKVENFSIKNYSIKEGNNTLTIVYREDGEEYEDTIIVKGGKKTTTTTTTPVTNPTGNGVWEVVNGKWKYKENGKYLANQWVQSAASGLWYWIEADGYMAANAWHNDNGTWYYLQADGSMAKGWVFVGGQWYYMDDVNGNMRVGWKWSNGICYYLDPVTGAMATNRWIGNYYVDGTGAWTQTR
ncbi:MAG: hypothetical protein J6J86_06925 [Lachnospiraceae bacterium]|nr:hypothetical protein [Lachnospiraceae bacterium]